MSAGGVLACTGDITQLTAMFPFRSDHIVQSAHVSVVVHRERVASFGEDSIQHAGQVRYLGGVHDCLSLRSRNLSYHAQVSPDCANLLCICPTRRGIKQRRDLSVYPPV